MTDVDRADLTVSDVTVFNNKIHVIVTHDAFNRRYRYDGKIGVDGVVKPLSMTGYRPGGVDEAIAEEGQAVARHYINRETPYEVYDGERKYYQREPTLRGLQYNQKQKLRSLTDEQKRELMNRVDNGDILLTGNNDD